MELNIRYLFRLITASLMLAVISCTSKEPLPTEPTEMTIAPLVHQVSKDGGQVVFTIQSDKIPSMKSDASWCSVGKRISENGAYKFTIDVQANTGYDERSAVLTASASGKESVQVTIIQSPKEADTLPEAKTSKAVISPSETWQTIAGFSASDCWAPAYIGKYWTGARTGISEMLFSRNIANGQPEGIGLSMWRSNLGGGSFQQGEASGIGIGSDEACFYRRGESYLNDDLTYDWTACEGQRYFLDRAKEFGVESIVLFSNSPNVQYTWNGKGYSQSGRYANLKDDCYDDFAVYMAEVAAKYKEWGYPVSHISPVNEPQYDWNGTTQEGTGWQNSQIAKLAKELDSSLTEKGLSDVKIILSEGGDWTYAYTEKNNGASNQIYAFFDPSSSDYVGDLAHLEKIYAGHSYWTDGSWNVMRNVRYSAYNKAKEYNLGLWQTEWSMLGDGYAASEFIGYDDASTMDIALWMAKVIHNDLTVANVSSWSFWTSMDVSRWGHKNRFLLVDFIPAGGTYSNDFTKEGTWSAQPTLWVLGNYSLFIRPGFQRISLTLEQSDMNLFGSAYISADGNRVVAVYINNTSDVVNVEQAVSDFQTSSIKAYTTSQDKNLIESNVTSGVIVLEPYSVTTVVSDK